MKLEDVRTVLEARFAWSARCADCADRPVNSCLASDLISDLLRFSGPEPILLTGLTNSQVIRTAEILDIVAIFFVRNKEPQPDAVELAQEKGIPLFVTPLSMFESSGRLFAKGLQAGTQDEESVECLTKR